VIVWLVQFVDILFKVLIFAIIARALLSWFSLGPSHPVVKLLYDLTEPVLAPLRRVIPMLGMFDITPIVAILLLDLARNFIITLVVRGGL
jgi:YggT family protein